LSGVQLSLQNYFPKFAVMNFRWEVIPFEISESSNLSAEGEEQLIDLRNEPFLQALFPQNSLDEFWRSAYKSYSMISVKAIKTILSFASSRLCEYGFSADRN